ncbi:Ldh family oxidoreductase [Streptomyces sp. NPDC087903]|uniref:Ldh family oxidoreductase n=1 Tax=Streptomyces sp. NPDC087903 TaxID=3365819 RepID=UPI003804803A
MTPTTPAGSSPVDGAPEAPRAVLRVRGVTKTFGGAAALKGVDLDLYPGEIHALMGMNGAGKSTLVQVLSGVHQPDGGTIEVNGRTESGLSVRRARRLGVACVPQRRELAMGLTVAENVMLGDLPTRRGAVDWKAVREGARGALSGLGIDIDVRRGASSLTVAEQTMVEVAREVRRGGRILILDEPTACLSAQDAHRIRTLVRTLRDDGVAVVYAGRKHRQNALLIAIDPAAFGDADAFTGSVDSTLSTLKGLPAADGGQGVFYPGERSASVAAERAERGIPVAPKVWRELTENAERFGLTPPIPTA